MKKIGSRWLQSEEEKNRQFLEGLKGAFWFLKNQSEFEAVLEAMNCKILQGDKNILLLTPEFLAAVKLRGGEQMRDTLQRIQVEADDKTTAILLRGQRLLILHCTLEAIKDEIRSRELSASAKEVLLKDMKFLVMLTTIFMTLFHASLDRALRRKRRIRIGN